MTLLAEVIESHADARLWHQLRGHRRIILFVTRLANTRPSEITYSPQSSWAMFKCRRKTCPDPQESARRMILGEASTLTPRKASTRPMF
jgi:hypothetical protein